MIQQLVIANPSPAYVGRVAAVFANNGAGALTSDISEQLLRAARMIEARNTLGHAK